MAVRVRFVTSALWPDQYPQGHLPEVAFAGRSNVGKSSLLNTLWGTRGMARTSSTPGRTRTINFYLVEDSFFFVDLPGYGYARAPLKTREEWAKGIEEYFMKRKNLKGVVVLMDSRIGPTELDRQMFQWLGEVGLPLLPVLTKADKASQGEMAATLRKTKALGLPDPIVFSAKTGQGKDRLWRAILDLLEGKFPAVE